MLTRPVQFAKALGCPRSLFSILVTVFMPGSASTLWHIVSDMVLSFGVLKIGLIGVILSALRGEDICSCRS